MTVSILFGRNLQREINLAPDCFIRGRAGTRRAAPWYALILLFCAGAMFPLPPVWGRNPALWNISLPHMRRPYPTIQPKMPAPARHLLVARVGRLPADQRVLLGCLQGIVNRKKPRIFLIWSRNDAFWLRQMEKQGQTGTPIRVRNPLSLVTRFASSVRGAVVPDPKVYVSPDIAADYAAADNLLIATPSLARRLHLPIRVDLRGKFHSDAGALRYLRLHLVPKLNPFLFLCLDPPLLADGSIDQIIAARGITLWVTGPKAADMPGANMAAERRQVELLFAHTPLNGVVRGFWWHGGGMGLDEGPGVTLASQFGKITVVSDYLPNMSVFSGVRMAAIKQKFAPPPKYDPSKVYLSFTISDGDNLCTWYDFFRHWFTNPDHGKFPVGWGMGPTLLDEAPTLVNWYYHHAGPNDEFICDVSGVGYMYPPQWARRLTDRRAAFRRFYQWTWRYMQRMDMKTLRLMGVNPASILRVGRALPKVRFLMPDYGYQGEKKYRQFTYTLPTGQPVFRAMTFAHSARQTAAQIRDRTGGHRPAFINVFIWNWQNNLPQLARTLKILGPRYVDVTPSQLADLYRQAQRRARK